MAAGSRILDEARILESLKLTHASLFLPSGGLLEAKAESSGSLRGEIHILVSL